MNNLVAGFGSAALYKFGLARSASVAGVITTASAVTVAASENLGRRNDRPSPVFPGIMTGNGVIMSSPDSAIEPFPYGTVKITGATYALGAVAGSAFHFFKGVRNSSNGRQFVGGTRALLMGAPSFAGKFAAFSCLIDSFECGVSYLRQKDDSWNPIIGGAAMFGFTSIRMGIGKASLMSLGGGLAAAMFEGAMINVELKKNQKQFDSMKVGLVAIPGPMQEARRDE